MIYKDIVDKAIQINNRLYKLKLENDNYQLQRHKNRLYQFRGNYQRLYRDSININIISYRKLTLRNSNREYSRDRYYKENS